MFELVQKHPPHWPPFIPPTKPEVTTTGAELIESTDKLFELEEEFEILSVWRKLWWPFWVLNILLILLHWLKLHSHVSPEVPEIMDNRAQTPGSIQNSNRDSSFCQRASPDGKAVKDFIMRPWKRTSFYHMSFLKWTSEAKASLSLGCMFGERDNAKWVFLALI